MRTSVLLFLSIALLAAAPAALTAHPAPQTPQTSQTPQNAAPDAAATQAPPTADELVRRLERFPSTKGAKGESERLAELFDLYWQFALTEFPELATYTGSPHGQDRWTDQSLERIAFRETLWPKALAAIESIDRGRLTPAEQLDYDLFRRNVRLGAESARFPGEYLAISQMNGVQLDPPQMIELMPARTVADFENVIGRLRNLPALVDQSIALLRQGLERGVTPPKVTLRDVPQQVEAHMVADPAKSPMLAAFEKLPESIPEPERERLRREAREVYSQQVAPAYRRLHEFLVTTYIPGARETVGLSAVPDGAAWYAFNAKQSTTTDLTPQQIHDIGLAEVKRIRAEMDEVIAKTGFKGTFAEFLTFLRTNPRFFFETPEELLAAYRDIAKRADPELVKLFGRLPRLPYGVVPVPAYAEKSQTTAYYQPGSLEAGRPGSFYANTYDLKSRPKWEMEALTLHEAVPGHHLQIALSQELEEAPEWRRFDFYTAYVEGWGLYAESLGEEMGFYQDPYAKFGQLTYEMWRAIRLVVDTGMHALGWTREQAIDFFKQNAGKAEHDIVVEVDRYIVWPGQALAYKIGELKLQELRRHAESELGPRFDVRAFHDEVLGRGALPLDVLETNVKAWVAEQKRAPQVESGGTGLGARR